MKGKDRRVDMTGQLTSVSAGTSNESMKLLPLRTAKAALPRIGCLVLLGLISQSINNHGERSISIHCWKRLASGEYGFMIYGRHMHRSCCLMVVICVMLAVNSVTVRSKSQQMFMGIYYEVVMTNHWTD